MKATALAVFRKPPEHLNCAQSIIHAHREVSGNAALSPTEMKAFGGGRAPGGLCGALYAACIVVPNQAERLKTEFAVRMGSVLCKELKGGKPQSCEACVAHAAELLEGAVKSQTPNQQAS